MVLALLQEHKLYAKASKCSFACDHIEYLSHIISRAGVATDIGKTPAMIKWPTPINATKLVSALHASAVNGHSCTTMTYHRVKKLFVWRGMKVDIDNYVQQCTGILAQPASSSHCPCQPSNGMTSRWTSSRDCRSPRATTHLWWGLIA